MASTKPARLDGRLFFVLALCLLPVVSFYVLLWRASRPVPMFDDYHAILRFALDFQQQHGAPGKLLYLFAAQHDEYKLIVEHAVIALDLTLTHQVHLGLLILIGNLLVAATAVLFWRNSFGETQDHAKRLLLFAPVILLLFQLNYAENLDWAMCALQTMPVVFFSLASLHFALRRRTADVLLACVCAMLACFSSANGFLVAPLGIVLLAMQRRFVAAFAWSATISLALVAYLYQYQRFTPPDANAAVSLKDKAMFFLAFLGGAVENMHHAPVANGSVVLGTVLVAFLLYAAQQGGWRRQPFPIAAAAWCLLSAAVVAQRRSNQGLVLSLTGRYKIYSDLLLICGYLLGAGSLAHSRISRRGFAFRMIPALLLAALFCVAGDVYGFKYLHHRQQRVELGFAQYAADPAHNSPEVSLGGEPFAGHEPEYALATLQQVRRRGLYHLPASSDAW